MLRGYLRRTAFTVMLLVPVVEGCRPAAAQPEETTAGSVRQKLHQMVQAAELGQALSLHVVRAHDGQALYAHQPKLALNPASNMKLLTGAAALWELGPGHSFLTGLRGHLEAGEVETLTIQGFGDPTLQIDHLLDFARQLSLRGVRRVHQIVVDGSYFDEETLPPGFAQQPHEIAAFRAAIGAVSVDRSAYIMRLLPGPETGQPARLRIFGDSYFDVRNSVTTVEKGPPKVVVSHGTRGSQMALQVSGSVPAGSLAVTYRRRVEQPLFYAGHLMAAALEAQDIQVSKKVTTGSPEHIGPLLASRRSPPLETILHAMGKYSDNFTAEMILKAIGANRKQPGSSSNGARLLAQLLKELGFPSKSFAVVNGSGLFEGNRLSASQLTALLSRVHRDSAIRAEYVSHLAVGGQDGTLRARLKDLPAERIVRAKTGTLADAIALSGFMLAPHPNDDLAFSFLFNGVRGKHQATRNLIDAMLRTLADHLYPPVAARPDPHGH